jgi:hypothetical protein
MHFDVEKWKAAPTIKTTMTEIREGLRRISIIGCGRFDLQSTNKN